jgi:ribose transport system substrate-binding protein
MRRLVRPSRLVLSLATAALLVFAAAGPASAASTGGKLKIAIVYHVTVPAVETFGYGAQAAATQLGIQLSITGPAQYDVLKQQAMSNAEANAGAKGIEEILVGASAWARNIAALQARHIAVVDLGVYTGPYLGKTTPIYVGPSDKAYGRTLGNLLVQALGPNAHGTVVIGTCVPGLLELVQRIDGVEQAIKQKEPGVKVVGPDFATDSYTQGVTDWQRIVLANPNALAFVGLCSTAPADLAKVKTSTGGKWLIVGGELDPGTLLGIKSGAIYGVVDANIWEQGYIGARLLYEELTNPKFANVTGWLDPGIETVTHANIFAVDARQSSLAAQTAYYEPICNALFANLGAHIKGLSASQA